MPVPGWHGNAHGPGPGPQASSSAASVLQAASRRSCRVNMSAPPSFQVGRTCRVTCRPRQAQVAWVPDTVTVTQQYHHNEPCKLSSLSSSRLSLAARSGLSSYPQCRGLTPPGRRSTGTGTVTASDSDLSRCGPQYKLSWAARRPSRPAGARPGRREAPADTGR